MNKCERLLDDAVAAHDELLADEHDRRIALVRETFNRIFPDWSDYCVEVVDRGGVTLNGGVRLELAHDAATETFHFAYYRRRRFPHWSRYSIPVIDLASLGIAVRLHREFEEEKKLRAQEKRDRYDARNAALDAYEKKGWLGRLFSKRPGYGVER